MKNRILFLAFFCLFSKGYAQTLSVKTTIVNVGGNVVEVYGNPSASFSNATFLEIDLVIGLANAGPLNPSVSSIVGVSKIGTLSNPSIDNSFGDSTVIGGRVYYLYKLFNVGGALSTWTTGISNPIATFQFPVDPTTLTMRLEDLTTGGSAYTGGGTNGNLFQFIDLDSTISNGAGTAGDVTAFNPMFYGLLASNNNPNGASFVPLQVADPLPVKFITFTASQQGTDGLLDWTVADEGTISKDYEVQKSIDNGISYVTIDTILITNPNATSNSYTFTDPNLSSVKAASNTIYYRIKQDDNNGAFVYSTTELIRLDNTNVDPSLSVYPNPVKDYATIKFDLNEDAIVTVKLTDVGGHVLQSLQYTGTKGTNTQPINLSSFVTGNYVLSLNVGADTHTVSLIKTN
jgi:type IX secretion system substrate protein